MDILIAENDPVSRSRIRKIVINTGHSVVEAETGRQAFDLVLRSEIRFVITDWRMPEMTGLQLCRLIRSGSFERHIYIVVIICKDRKNDLVDVFKVGADDYVHKPFNPAELKARIITGLRILELEERHERMLSTLSEQLETKNKSLKNALTDLEQTQLYMLQSEKLASIGQLAAGVAHEINNPTGYVSSNLKTLVDYQEDISRLLKIYRDFINFLEKDLKLQAISPDASSKIDMIRQIEQEIDIDFLLTDITELIADCREGTDRIRKIVQDLKDFAHPGEDSIQSADINSALQSTLNIVHNELKYKATLHTDFGPIPCVLGYPQQLNQVFMNILVNAAQAIKKKGDIFIKTWCADSLVHIRISDTGCGIPDKNISKIFDPFFTTKDVGKGTGLGMNIAYHIIQKHHGSIAVASELGKGTCFTISLPVADCAPC